MTEILVADIGGTRARFAIALREPEGGIGLHGLEILEVARHAGIEAALAAYAARIGRPLPARLAVALAAPVPGTGAHAVRLTNSPWVIRPAALRADGRFERLLLLNDLAAVAHAVAVLPAAMLVHVAGPDRPLPACGPVTVIGPGTGLGAAILLQGRGAPRVVATEGGHMDFAPLDPVEDRILAHLRRRHGRVSVERVVSGPGLAAIHGALLAIGGRPAPEPDDAALWAAALSGTDEPARAALERWCMSLGSVAGDLALAHGAAAVVLAGGLVARAAPLLARSGFHARFCAKGRFAARMAALPVRRVAHAQAALLGAAAAFLAGDGGKTRG